MIDFHCHLDLYPNPIAIIGRPEIESMYILAVTTTPMAWEGNCLLVKERNRIRVALGLHPELVAERHHEISLFIQLLPLTRYVGEIGLDGSPHLRSSFQKQDEIFRQILRECARHDGRILSIHSRGAATEVLDALSDEPDAGTPVLHWFTGSLQQLDRAIKLGCWFSVGPAMLQSAKGRRLAEAMPQERVLTETDAPFTVVRGNPLLPWQVGEAEEGLALIWKQSKEAVSNQMSHNFRNLLHVREN